MGTMVILDGPGPTPLNATFESPTDGPVVFVLSATAWTQSAPTMLGINLLLDGVVIGNPAMCYANSNSMHMTLRPTFIPFEGLTFDTHKISIEPANGYTINDVNDYFQVVLMY